MNKILACTIAALVSLPASALAQQKPLTPSAMDYIEIQQLVNKYAKFIDSCSNNGYDYADLFTADGSFVPVINGKPAAGIQGRERLAEVSGGGSRGCKNVGWIQQGVRHLYPNHVIEATADGAKGTVDMLMIGLGGDPNKIQYDGHYEDVYVKTPQGWRFKQRTHFALLSGGRPATPPPAKCPALGLTLTTT